MDSASTRRYSVMDAYLQEELKRKYQHGNVEQRIRLLESIKHIPEILCEMAVADEHVQVRQWTAHNARYLDEKSKNKILKDSDELVRASFFENPHLFRPCPGGAWITAFKKATWIERCAMVRNPNVSIQLIERIADCNDKELKLSKEEKKELMAAFATNEEHIMNSGKNLYDFFQYDEPSPPSVLDVFRGKSEYNKLWQLMSEWEKTYGFGVSIFYENIGCEDAVKANIFSKSDAILRLSILLGCDADDVKTLALGKKEQVGYNRRIAYSKISWRGMDASDIKKMLAGDDNQALLGMLENSYFLEQRGEIEHRLEELGEHDEVWRIRYQQRKAKDEDRAEKGASNKIQNKLSEINTDKFRALSKEISYLYLVVIIGFAVVLYSIH